MVFILSLELCKRTQISALPVTGIISLIIPCFFEKSVYANDGETEIFSDNLDLLATENSVQIYNNVKLDYNTGSLRADKIDYDFETKYFKVSMFNDEKIKMKVIK